VRNRVLIALLYCSGLRLSEALALDLCDLDQEHVRVSGRRAREAHLFEAARPYLEVWTALRAEIDLARAPYFCTLRGERLSTTYVRAMLTRLARCAGLEQRVHAHLLRHSCAARLARAGLDGEALARQLGQASPRGARRALERFAVPNSSSARRSINGVPWSLAPEPGRVRALLVKRGTPHPQNRDSGRARITVRRWRPEAL
jgi:integrase